MLRYLFGFPYIIHITRPCICSINLVSTKLSGNVYPNSRFICANNKCLNWYCSFKVLISNFKKPINKSYLFIIGLFIAYEWSHIFYYDIKSIILLFSWSFAILYVSLYFFYSLKSYNHKVVIIYSIAGVLISIFYGTLDFLRITEL